MALALRACVVCTTEYKPIRINQKYCERCYFVMMLRRKPGLRKAGGVFAELAKDPTVLPHSNCLWCDESFLQVPSNKVYCSPGCWDKHRTEKRRIAGTRRVATRQKIGIRTKAKAVVKEQPTTYPFKKYEKLIARFEPPLIRPEVQVDALERERTEHPDTFYPILAELKSEADWVREAKESRLRIAQRFKRK